MAERKKAIVNRGILELIKRVYKLTALSRLTGISVPCLKKNFYSGSHISVNTSKKLIQIFPNVPKTFFSQSVELEFTPPFSKKTIEAIKQQDFLNKHKLKEPDKYDDTKKKR